MAPIKVFVIDDSAVVRQAMLHMLSDHPDLVLVGTASNPLVAGPAIKKIDLMFYCSTLKCREWMGLPFYAR